MESGYRAEDVARQEAAVRAAEAALASAETDLADTRLVAPQDGVVLTKVRERGAVVQAGETVYAITINNPVWIRAYVAQPNLGNIRPGRRCFCPSMPDRTRRTGAGSVSFLLPQNLRPRPWKRRRFAMISSSVSG